MSKKNVTIIGIGASAGGLEALQIFIAGLPVKSNIAYIIAQHLSPTYKSLMVELLAKGTNITVLEASNGTVVQADTIYVCPPDENIFLDKETILLSKPKVNWHGPKPSVDLFFESLAESQEEKSIGIILSGTGSDGSRGVRAIKAAGGFTIVQEPKSAKYDGMPNSAIYTGTIDLILHPEDIGSEIQEVLNYTGKIAIKKTGPASTNIYKNILTKVREIKGVDFNLYKPSTIERRIERRMIALKIIKINDYYAFLLQNVDEVELLFKDILIGVTTFFRDGDSFYVLKQQITDYLKTKSEKHIRIWAPGCSTGEEAYSLAMILSEILGADIANYQIQIFATDINEDALYFARKGMYPESALLELDKKLQNRYFNLRDEHYEVVKPIREMVIFSRHNILKDPAFLRLDLLVCRNLLIYFSQELQKKLFPEFHYALNDNALLFLGKSESVGHFQSYFKTVDKKWKIYKSNFLGTKELPRIINTYQKNDLINSAKIISETKKPTLDDILVQHVYDYIIPMCLIINENMDIVYVKGENPYLVRPNGEQTQNIFKNLNNGLSIEVRAAIHESTKYQSLYKSNFQKITLFNKIERFVRVVVVPMKSNTQEALSLLCFQEEDSENFKHYTGAAASDENPHNIKLEEELKRAKEYLQTVIEELETSNEEMQSLNEELQSSNEELQSSNEELETTNEELQSTNEELQTAYTELRSIYEEREDSAKEILEMNKEHTKTNQRLSAALECANLGICDYHIPISQKDVWDERWAAILGFTPGELPGDKSNMTEWMESRIHIDDLKYFQNTYKDYLAGKINDIRIRIRILNKSNEYIWVESFAIANTRDSNGNVLHSVGTLKDITQEMTDKLKLETAVEQLRDAQKIALLGSWDWDIQTNELWWSEETYTIFGQNEETFDKSYTSFLNLVHEDDRTLVQNSIKDAMENDADYDITHRIYHPTKGIRHVREIASLIYDENQKSRKMIGTVQDISRVLESKKLLIENEKRLEVATQSANIGVWEMKPSTGEIYWDNKSYEIFGVEKGTEITYYLWNKIIHPDDLEMIEKEIDLAIEEKRQFSNLFRVLKANGEFTYVQGTGIPMYENDILTKIVGTNTNVTSYILKNMH